MVDRKLSNSEFLKLLEDSDLNIIKKAEEFERLDYKVSLYWLKGGMSEEELLEASLRYLELASKVQKKSKIASLLLKSKTSNLTNIQKDILKLAVDWSNILKQSYKCYSDYLAYRRVDDENVSSELKEKANIKKETKHESSPEEVYYSRTKDNTNTPFYKYMQKISKTRLLTALEEVRLAKKISKGSKEAKEELIKSNLRLVVSVAKIYQGMWDCHF